MAVLATLTVLVIAYAIDAIRASTHILNLILVLPLTVGALALCAVQFALDIVHLRDEPAPREPAGHVLPVMALFAAYVLSLEWLGFDVGTFAFMCAFLWFNGERRLQWLLGYSISFTAVTVLFFSKMLPYPMPMLILGTAY